MQKAQHRSSYLKPYSNLRIITVRYWKSYGGYRAIARSPYFHFSLLFTIISYSIWRDEKWWDISISVIPSLVGFTLGGYTVFLAFGDEKFRNILVGATKDGETSPFMAFNSTYVHFIIMQIVSIFLALLAKSRPIQNLPESVIYLFESYIPQFSIIRLSLGTAFWFLGYLSFIYAIALTIAATFGIFRMAHWFEYSKRTDGTSSEK